MVQRRKISDLEFLGQTIDDDDFFPVVDHTNNVTRKIKFQDLLLSNTFSGGTEAAPGISFTGDSDTGLARLSADEIAICANGVAIIKNNASNNIELHPAQGKVRIYEADGSSYAEIVVPTMGSNNAVLTLPSSTGTLALTTDIPSGVVVLDSNNKVPANQIPDIAITEYKGAVANQTAMLAVTGEKGDWVVRNDDGKVYVITGTDPTSASDWTALSYPITTINLSYTDSTRTIGNSAGNDAVLPFASETVAGLATFDGTDFNVASGDVTINTSRIQNLVGAMFSGNTETDIVVTYQSADGTIDLVVTNISGNAGTATALAAAVDIGGVSFDGQSSIDLPGVNQAGNQSTSGNAATATKLAAAVNIGGVSFEGDTAIDLPGVNLQGNQNTTGNAATATALANARLIGGVSFDGSANINLPGVNTTGNQDTSGNAATATVAASTSGNAATATQLLNSRFIGGVAFNGTANVVLPGVNATGNQDTSGTAAKATRLESTRSIGGVSFDGTADIDLPGVNTTGNQDTTGNAATATTASTATTLATARNIGGVSFDGSADINLPGVNTTGTQNTTGTAAFADELATARTIGGVSFDGSQNINLPGVNTAGNQDTTGSAASAATCTGNAATATKLATARNIGGVSFDGSANINLPGVNTAGNQNTSGTATFATELATARTIGGVSFDGSQNIDLPGVNTAGNQDTTGSAASAATCTGNAATATKLATARNIGGVSFDGSANINLPGVNTAGNQDTTGTATYATELATGRNIGGVFFDGSSDITLPGVNAAGNQNTSGNANTATALLNAQTITLTGAITGSGSFTGDAGTTISTTGSGFVDTSNSQTIGGIKTFTSDLYITGTRLYISGTTQDEKIMLQGTTNPYISFYEYSQGSNTRRAHIQFKGSDDTLHLVNDQKNGRLELSDTLNFNVGTDAEFEIGTRGEIGVGGSNYGTSGQVLTSGGTGSAPSWTTLSTGNASTLDNLDSTQFLRSDANDTYTGILSISGSINNASTGGSSGAILGNLEVGYGAAYNSISARSNNSLHLNYNSSGTVFVGASNAVWHAGNDGPGSSLYADTANALQGAGGLTNAVGSSALEYSGQISNGTTGLFSASNNANGIVRLNTHPGNYYHDLGFSSNGQLYHRYFNNSNAFTTTSWNEVWTSANFANNSSNWNTAYSWGNHASAGYLTSFDITTQTDSKYLRSNATDNTDTNVKTRFGGSSITQQSGSSAVVQINGFSRIGALAMHRSANPTSGNGAPDADHEWLTNIGGVLRWGTNASTADNTIWNSGHFANNSSNWNTAYSWGNHATAGYLTSGSVDAATLDSLDSSQFLRSDTEDSLSGALNINGGTLNATNDATLYVTASNNNDWGIRVGANSGKTEYGMSIQMGSSFNYGLTVRKGAAHHFVVNSTGAQVDGNYVWHAGNDGPGSQLNADKIDNVELSGLLQRTFEDSDRNLIIQNPSSSNGAGIEFRRNDGNFQGQLYFDNGTTAGFLDSSWGGWDLKKNINGDLAIKKSGSMFNVAPLHTSNYSGTYNIPIETGNFLYPNPNAGAVTITGSTGQISTPNHGNSSQWNTAYGWGNHASAGYLTAGSVDAATLDGQNSAYYRNASNLNAGTFPDLFSNTTRYNIQYIDGHGNSDYDKLRVWDSSSYTIGMYQGQTHGWLNDYAMTFTMNDDSDRGWKWRDTNDGVNNGAMSLTTGGNLCVQNAIGIGQTGRYLVDVAGDYGSIQTGGTGRNSWQGYNINERAVFMDNGSDVAGIFDDVNNEWWMLCRNNAEVELFYNGSEKFETRNDGCYVTGSIYVTDWIYNTDAGQGIFNSSTNAHFVSDGAQAWSVRPASSESSIRIEFKTNGTTLRGSVYANSDPAIGFLNSSNEWGLKYKSSNGNSPNLYFREEGNEDWTGNPGSDEGKIEYHSNRFYIASGSNSTEIVQFRRSGDNKAVIDNSGNFTAQGNVTAYSDLKFKDDIQVIPNALDKVQQMRGVTYVRNDHEEDQERQAGVIAQEVEKVFPEVVRERENGKTVAYGNMVGLLIEAVKELRAEVSDLKAEVARLQSDKS